MRKFVARYGRDHTGKRSLFSFFFQSKRKSKGAADVSVCCPLRCWFQDKLQIDGKYTVQWNMDKACKSCGERRGNSRAGALAVAVSRRVDFCEGYKETPNKAVMHHRGWIGLVLPIDVFLRQASDSPEMSSESSRHRLTQEILVQKY